MCRILWGSDRRRLVPMPSTEFTQWINRLAHVWVGSHFDAESLMSDKNKHKLYVERRLEANDYAVRRAVSSWASAVCDTQAAAIV